MVMQIVAEGQCDNEGYFDGVKCTNKINKTDYIFCHACWEKLVRNIDEYEEYTKELEGKLKEMGEQL